jgi:rRNA maturation RNase YbeY|tara:strand:+ start:368 stop:790 length:423 start_codon:yes stop_codon:yes gene_type:complete
MPIEFVYNIDFILPNENKYSSWLTDVASSEGFSLKKLVYAFFNDEDLKDLNIKHLNHNFYTDVLSFDDSLGKEISGNIAISIERVKENAKRYSPSFDNELKRVMVHGLLHLIGYNDSTPDEVNLIRAKEEKMLRLFHVKQ